MKMSKTISRFWKPVKTEPTPVYHAVVREYNGSSVVPLAIAVAKSDRHMFLEDVAWDYALNISLDFVGYTSQCDLIVFVNGIEESRQQFCLRSLKIGTAIHTFPYRREGRKNVFIDLPRRFPLLKWRFLKWETEEWQKAQEL